MWDRIMGYDTLIYGQNIYLLMPVEHTEQHLKTTSQKSSEARPKLLLYFIPLHYGMIIERKGQQEAIFTVLKAYTHSRW